MKKLFLLLVLSFSAAGVFAATTVIYHTSDMHGFYYPKAGVGGAAVLAELIDEGPEDYLLLDSGDFSNGTAEAKNSKGLKSVDVMNKLGFHATTIGNHEFDFKDKGVAPILQRAEFAVLAANFFEKESGKYPQGVRPYQIFEVDDVDVAVIGLANTNPTNKSKQYKFTQPLPALEKVLKEKPVQEADVVVVIAHDALVDEEHGTQAYISQIAEKFGGQVNVVFGGHAHHIVQNHYINGVLFVESGNYYQQVSKVTIETDDETGKFISAKSEIIPLVVDKIGQDEEVAAYVEALKEPGMDEVFGEAAETIKRTADIAEHKDSPLNNWIADLGRVYAGTEIFVHNNGGTRIDMEKGVITKRETVDMHPFENTITKMTVNGKFLKYLVKKSLLPRSLFSYSGMTITYRNKKGKVKDLKIYVNGKPVENRKKYTLATNEYIAFGGSEGWPFNRIDNALKEKVGTGNVRTILEDGIKKYSPVKAVATGRIVEVK